MELPLWYYLQGGKRRNYRAAATPPAGAEAPSCWTSRAFSVAGSALIRARAEPVKGASSTELSIPMTSEFLVHVKVTCRLCRCSEGLDSGERWSLLYVLEGCAPRKRKSRHVSCQEPFLRVRIEDFSLATTTVLNSCLVRGCIPARPLSSTAAEDGHFCTRCRM